LSAANKFTFTQSPKTSPQTENFQAQTANSKLKLRSRKASPTGALGKSGKRKEQRSRGAEKQMHIALN